MIPLSFSHCSLYNKRVCPTKNEPQQRISYLEREREGVRERGVGRGERERERERGGEGKQVSRNRDIVGRNKDHTVETELTNK